MAGLILVIRAQLNGVSHLWVESKKFPAPVKENFKPTST